MGVLIRGIKMPTACEDCFFADYLHNDCRATGNYILRKKDEEKPSWCPLIEVPSADVVEIRHGKWEQGDLPTYGGYKCSLCGESTTHYKANFCPNCGATMVG